MSESRNNVIDRKSVYISAGLISACGALMFNVLPVFVGALAEAFSFSESQLGDIIACFNIAFTLIAISALFWIRAINWRLTSAIGVLISIIAFVLMPFSQSYVSIIALTAGVGIGMGMLYALVMAILGDSDFPDRAFGLKLGLETIPGAIGLFVLPTFIFPNFGFSGVALSLAGLLLVLGIATFWLPAHNKNRSDLAAKTVSHAQSSASTPNHTSSATRSHFLSAVALLSSLAFFTGIVASWAFLDLLASNKGLSAEDVGKVLSIGFIICGIGGFAAAMIGTRWGQIKPFVFIIVVNLFGLWQLSIFNGLSGYAVGACLFLFSVNFALAYTFGLTAKVDDSGKLVVLSAAVLSIGAIIGPFFSGRIVENYGYNNMLLFSGVCLLISLALYLMVVYLHKTTIQHQPSESLSPY